MGLLGQRFRGWLMPRGRRSKQEDSHQPEGSASSAYQLRDLVPFGMVSVGQPALAAEVVQRALHYDPFIIWALGTEQQPNKVDKPLARAKPWEEALSEYLNLAATQGQQQQQEELQAQSKGKAAPKSAAKPTPTQAASSSRLLRRAHTTVDPAAKEALSEDAALRLYAEL